MGLATPASSLLFRLHLKPFVFSEERNRKAVAMGLGRRCALMELRLFSTRFIFSDAVGLATPASSLLFCLHLKPFVFSEERNRKAVAVGLGW
ncbi:hypothetical protein FH972_017101 [Carpinus fangiana]|uniref:Uncharacterized protein n=1 Tax=Carpinus fangiana TaxID=176857 RepID=A0A5N6RJ76_9ROSI|nr:hypothetical protein FH972_017101 [Carpinus fangiana]